ncbi:hypothetical protein CK203_025217 [Vitis vinifera]|uniref:Uncharacterized protein n=1 Tax=Vitis vinifera TaxID=29760 RepID=A0A438JEY9_VITVI|nr:hypothetical protein CK203_025217 [Vitis vinifera]
MRIRGIKLAQKLLKPTRLQRLSSSSQRAGSSTKAIALLCPGDERVDAEAIFGVEGRAIELKPEERSPLVWKSGLEGKENEARKGKAPAVQMRDSTEDTSAFREEDKEGLTGRVGFDPRGSSDMVSPSNSIIRGVVDSLKYVDIPVRVEEENQCALSNQMTESFTHRKSNVRKMAKVREVLCFLDIKVYSKRKNRGPTAGTLGVWAQGISVGWLKISLEIRTGLLFPASGASGGILIIWDSKDLRSEEVVIGSFSVSVKFALDGCGPLWISAVYGPNSPPLRKDFWVELFDIYGLTYPLWCVGGDFNVRRRSSEKLGGSSLTSSMRDFDSFIRECELLDPPLRNASFTWSNLQESPENFRNWWSGFQGNRGRHKFMRRLQYVKAKLKEWNKFSFGELNEKKKSILNDLANFDAIEQGEIHWRQKARVKWVKEGDCNSKFYHKVANGRRNRKYIKELENERGLVLKNAESITEEILLYFEKLYTSPTGEAWGVEGLDWDKAPGPDGFTIAVFQDCWDVFKEDLGFYMRPSTILKAFVQGRQILDAVLIANEIVDERRRSGEEGVVFKIDFEKAYDHVKWDFLDHVLEKKGFSPRWRKWMSGCLSSVSYAILVNGSAKGEEELQTLKSLLLVFGHISGLKVNLDKSSIYGINLDQAHLSRLAVMLDCKASDWPILYLGLPLGGNPKACGFWDPVIERISSRLDGWQKAYLSLGEDNSYPILPYPYAMDWGRQKRSFSEVGCCVQIEGNKGFGFWEYFFEESRSSREMVVEMVTSLSLEGYCTSLSGVFLVYSLVKMDWVPPRSIFDMMSIKFKGFGTSKKGIVLWQAASINSNSGLCGGKKREDFRG